MSYSQYLYKCFCASLGAWARVSGFRALGPRKLEFSRENIATNTAQVRFGATWALENTAQVRSGATWALENTAQVRSGAIWLLQNMKKM